MFVVGNESARSTLVADSVAIAYISNKPMLIATTGDRGKLLSIMVFGM